MDLNKHYDAVIIGGGPAGLSGAIYLARAHYSVLVLEKDRIGGRAASVPEIVNYPGLESTDGSALAETMKRQAESFGAVFASAEAVKIEKSDDIIGVTCADGSIFTCVSLMLATGATPLRLGFTGESEFRGRGVAYCAECDGEFFTDCPIVVAGGGDEAADEAVFLSRYASRLIFAEPSDKLPYSHDTVEKLQSNPAVTIKYNTVIESVSGGNCVECVRLKNTSSGAAEDITDGGGVIGVFLFAGSAPASGIAKDLADTDKDGFILTDRSQSTSSDGIFAAGDVCAKDLRQIVTAVSDGAAAAVSMEKYISSRGGSTAAVRPSAPAEQKQHHSPASDEEAFISGDMRDQICGVFDKLEGRGLIEAVTASDEAAAEIESFVREFDGLHQNVAVKITRVSDAEHSYIAVSKEGEKARIRYYSVPGGHEFTSFILAVYNAVGPGQEVGNTVLDSITALKPHKLQVMVTLSCTNCPEVVKATQRIASLNSNIEAEMYDLSKFPDIKARHNIMAVPCMIVDGEKIHFGKKNLAEIISLL